MSLCPYCLSHDKDYFADKCHNCNTEVSFGDQTSGSVTWVLTTVAFWVTIILIIAAFIG
jgi:hypothetical protein